MAENKGQIQSCFTHFEGVKEYRFKVSHLRLQKFIECRKKWAKLHCEQANIAKNSYDIFDDSYLNSQLSKDNESFDLDCYHKTCYKKFCANTESISSRVEMEVMKPVEPRRKLTRNSDAQPSKAMP